MSSSRAFTYMHLAQAEMLEKLYQAFLQDPSSVDLSWRHFFEGVEFASYQKIVQLPTERPSDDLRIYHLIDAYRKFGHLEAEVNPIATHPSESVRELSLETLNFQESDLSARFPTCGLLSESFAPLSQIISTLKETYCSTVGIEYMGMHSPELEKWVQSQIEPARFKPSFSIDQKRKILDLLNQAELFETFLHTKYVGQKRFSLEGGETLIPILGEILERGGALGMDEFVLGMSHRGRLNVLVNILKKSFSMVFSEFEDFVDPNLTEGAGDVKYHKGYSSTVTTSQGASIHISLMANPSHLESVDPIVMGKARARQTQRGDHARKKIVPILIHGDGSLAGQGIVYETLQLHKLQGYASGGTLHIVINNQIGFTTLARESRSTRYCTAIAQAFGFPVLHVNAEDPEGCTYATQLALTLRHLFQCDVFIDLNCYRKYGHNEGDEPAFTQPLQYQIIHGKKTIREIYRDRLIQQGVLEKEMALGLEEEFKKALHFELEELKLKKEPSLLEAFGGAWSKYHKVSKADLLAPVNTAVDLPLLKEIGMKSTQLPENFEVHKKLLKWIEERKKMIEGRRTLDWAMAEHLAIGSLLWEGNRVRLSGQDSQRGTFTQRHGVWVDQKTGERYFPLAHLKENQGNFSLYNSPLSEFAAVGFEWGYSLASPDSLILWEAQFGDFANGAQVIFDQYLAASAQKWQRYSGLTLLLPHGYEGQGAEHSSARLERFLQLAAESNMQIVYPTTPAQYFHLLRRQIKRNIRVPLVIMTPKGLLRYAPCSSVLEDLAQGRFQEILDDAGGDVKGTRLLLCTGRIYYDLIAEREKRKADHCVIIRIEQLYPFHIEAFKNILEKFREIKEYFWVQEEPRNMGAFGYIYPILQELIPKQAALQYVGRARSASTATGSHTLHEKEHRQLMEMAYL
jgi:2-oxoglutarate dehydrogenase E1 component